MTRARIMKVVHVAIALLGTGVIVVGLQWLAHGGLSGP